MLSNTELNRSIYVDKQIGHAEWNPRALIGLLQRGAWKVSRAGLGLVRLGSLFHRIPSFFFCFSFGAETWDGFLLLPNPKSARCCCTTTSIFVLFSGINVESPWQSNISSFATWSWYFIKSTRPKGRESIVQGYNIYKANFLSSCTSRLKQLLYYDWRIIEKRSHLRVWQKDSPKATTARIWTSSHYIYIFILNIVNKENSWLQRIVLINEITSLEFEH